jgi:AraC-like DNA-binding protein/ligand-binding sensor protein
MAEACSRWRGNEPQVNGGLEQWRWFCQVLKTFHKATGLAARLIPVEDPGAATLESSGAPLTGVCALLRGDPEGQKACRAVHERTEARLRSHPAPCQRRCFAGLTGLVAPVVMEGKLVGLLEGGQVVSGKHSERACAAVLKGLRAAGIQVNSTRFRSAYFKTACVPDAQLQGAVQLLHLLGQHFSDSVVHRRLSQRRAEPLAVVRAKSFAQDHYSEAVKAHNAAQATHLSLPHFCRVFKTSTGMTFTEFLNRWRVQKARQFLEDWSLRITDIAFAAGFQSLPHFDRTFKRYTGQTPKAFRTALSSRSPLACSL